MPVRVLKMLQLASAAAGVAVGLLVSPSVGAAEEECGYYQCGFMLACVRTTSAVSCTPGPGWCEDEGCVINPDD